MNLDAFIQQLPQLGDNRSKPISESQNLPFSNIPSTNTAYFLTLLNQAVQFLDSEEVYCEIGSSQGASLIAALFNNPESQAYSVDDFSELAQPEETLEMLYQNVSDFELDEQIVFCNQSFAEFFRELKQLETPQNIGVFFYDAACDYQSVLLALLLAQQFLSEKALIIISNANEPEVFQAAQDFQLYYPKATSLLKLSSKQKFDWYYGNGYLLLSWQQKSNFTASVGQTTITNKPLNTSASLILEVNKQYLRKQGYKLIDLALYLEAEYLYKILLIYDLHDLEALLKLGIVYYYLEKFPQAQEHLDKALTIDSCLPEAYFYLGKICQDNKQIQEAIAYYNHAIQLDKQYILANQALGTLLETVNLDQAEAFYRRAPKLINFQESLCQILITKNQWEEAKEIVRELIKHQPHNPKVLNNLAQIYQAQGENLLFIEYQGHSYFYQREYQKACNCYENLIRQHRQSPLEVYLNLCLILEKLQHTEESYKIAQQAKELYPDSNLFYICDIELWQSRGDNKRMLAALDLAEKTFPNDLFFSWRKQLALPLIYENTQEVEEFRHDFVKNLTKITEEFNFSSAVELETAKQAISQLNIFLSAYQGYDITLQQKQYGNLVDKIISASYPEWCLPITLPATEGKIRVGYISEAMNSGSISRWLLGWLKNHDRENFEIYCYKLSNSLKDDTTKKIILYSDHFREIAAEIDNIAKKIREDNLHILVYTGIGLENFITQLACLRLAPIQCSSWGHPLTSGLPKMDYFISGEVMEPENAQLHYTERLITLPNLGICYQKPELPKNPKTRFDFNFNPDWVIYLSCQLIVKYLPKYDYIFAEIAQKVEKAKFVFIVRSTQSNKSTKEIQQKFALRLEKVFRARNLDYENYCIFLEGLDWESYLSILMCADVFLDTLSFSGGYTSFEAVACNLPLVTMAGEFMRSRQSYGILQMLQVTDTVATSEAEYIEIASELGLDANLRREIAAKMKEFQSNLFDDYSCVQGLEEFYQKVVFS